MEKHIKQLPQDILALVYCARDVSESTGLDAYLVGGFVRDLILRRKNYDLDITVEGPGIDFAQAFARKAGGRLVSHRRFGTATVFLPARHKIDFATTRKERYPQPAALPEVSAGTLDDDLFRRDFAINTLAIGLSAPRFGRLIDRFHGCDDIRDGLVRVLHDLSFIDDPTRILRCVRFEQRFGFSIEHHTLDLLKEASRSGSLSRVNPHRLRDELILILKEEEPARPLSRLAELAGLDFIAPGAAFSRQTARDFQRIAAAAAWFRERFPGHRQCELRLAYLMRLLEPLGFEQAKKVCFKFAFAKNDTKRIMEYIRNRSAAAAALSQPSVMRPSKLFRLLSPLGSEELVLLKTEVPAAARHIGDFLEKYHSVRVSLSGHDLKALGIMPGPRYQRILRGLLDAKLDGTIRTREDELKFVSRISKSA